MAKAESKQSTPVWDITRLTAAVTGFSIVLGVAALLGQYAALSGGFRIFLSFEDVVSEAISVAPFALLGIAFAVWETLTSPKPEKKISPQTLSKELRRARWVIAPCLILIGIVFWTFPPIS